MKKQISIYSLLAAALIMVSCSHDEQGTNTNGRTALKVTSGIQSRAYDNQWESNDAIGIYMLNGATIEEANKKYITAAGGETGTFAPAIVDQTIYFPVDGSTRDFVAYYPFANIGVDNLYNVNVATQSSQKEIDLMAATKITGKSKTDATVAFDFEHKLAKLEIILKGDGESTFDADLANTVVKITNQQTAATYDVVNGGDVNITTGSPTDITLFTNGLKAEGIVLPNNTTANMQLTFAVPAPIGQTFSWDIISAPLSQKFEGGKKYKYTITIAKVGINVTSTVSNWIPGNESGEEGEAN